MNSALQLRPDRIVVTIPTVNPAADASRYMNALRRTIQVSMMNEYIDYEDLQELHALMELLNCLVPIPDENDLKRIFKLK
jgi:hypothetical protein